MKILRNILGYRDFNQLNNFKDYLVRKDLITQSDFDSISYIILFSTSKQKTWVLSDSQSLFCFLDDSSKDSFEFRWKESKENLKNNIEIRPDYKANTGIVDFGINHKKWLYSKGLFKSKEDLENRINELMK